MRFPEISVPIHLLLACTLVIVWKVKLHCSFTHLVPNTLYTLIIGPFSILTGSMRFMNCIWWEWVRQQKDTEVQVDLGDWPRCPLTPTWHSIMGILKTVCTSFKKTNVLLTAWLYVLQIVEINKNIRMVYVCSWLWSWMHFQVSKLVIDKNTGNDLVVFVGSALHYESKYFSPCQSTHGH